MKFKLNSLIQKINQLHDDRERLRYHNHKFRSQTMNIEADEFQEILSWVNDTGNEFIRDNPIELQ